MTMLKPTIAPAIAAASPPTSPPPWPPELIRLRSGDPEALAECYRRHAGALLLVVYRLTASWADAEDVVHDAFVALPEALSRYEERGQFAAWLTRVAIRLALRRQRREFRFSSMDTVPPPTVGTTTPDHIVPPRVHAALAALSPTLRHVFVLRTVHDMSHADIGALLGISAGTSEVRYHRAVKALRRTLEVSV
ncbi:MAG: sigma-70 family RNA polymerase sigma factor [Gemmatimonadaceae bacterium]|nr:sigma-70 family RNA polymerase sigma factor [Gemmatimonadaceae bacterium]